MFRVLGAALGLAGCYSPVAPFGVPCSASSECPTGQQCDELTGTCMLPTELRTWRDDTAADFTTPGAALDEAAIETTGFVGPAAYLTGRVRLAGIADHLIGDPASATWASLAAAPITGTSFEHTLDIDYANIPRGLGLAASDDITVLVEGEIYLDVAGAWAFELTANDRGFLEVAPPGSAAFSRVISDINLTSEAPYPVTAPGWHRFRGAVSDAAMDLEFILRVDPPNEMGNFRDIPAEQMRARVDDLAGFVVDGFANQALLNYGGSSLANDSLTDAMLSADPYGLPLGGDFTLRWSGQVLIDVGGDYALRIDSYGGHRAWLDGVEVANRFATSAALSITTPMPLDAGWHDVVIDLQRQGGPAGHLALTVESGPTWVGQGIPDDHVRPVVGRGVRWAAAHGNVTIPVPDNGSSTGTVSVELPPNMSPLEITAAFVVDHPNLSSLAVVLDPPMGGSTTLAAAGSMSGSGAHSARAVIPPSNAGTTWNFIVTDGVFDLAVGALRGMAVTLVCSGGVEPVPRVYSYESTPRELGEVVAWGTLDWGLRQATTGSARIQVRSCDDAAGCAAQPWVAAIKGARPTIPVRRFAQYHVELTSNGDIPTALDWIELEYSAAAARVALPAQPHD